MGSTHRWTQCQPAAIAMPGAEPARAQAGTRALLRLWEDEMDDAARRHFHEFICEGDRSPEALATVVWMRERLDAVARAQGFEIRD